MNNVARNIAGTLTRNGRAGERILSPGNDSDRRRGIAETCFPRGGAPL